MTRTTLYSNRSNLKH